MGIIGSGRNPVFVAEWWPSSAKLVLNRVYERDFHVPEMTFQICCLFVIVLVSTANPIEPPDPLTGQRSR